MNSYVPPHKRTVNSNKIDFNSSWINDDQHKKPINQNLKNAYFPKFNENSDKSNDNTTTTNEVYNYKKVTELFKKKRELREKKKKKLKPGWINLNKNNKYKKPEQEKEYYYQTFILPAIIESHLTNKENYYRDYEETYNEDIRYYVSESESEPEFSEEEEESLSENDYENEEYYEEQEIYLNKYNRN